MARMFGAAAALLCIGCGSLATLDGFPLPPEARQPGKTFAVQHQPADERDLHQPIEASLRARGLDVVTGDAGSADYVVSYVDRWYWDMRMYLIDLRIDVRDARTDVLIATARSYQSSLAAMGETHDSVIDRTVDVLIEGMEARLRDKEQAAQRKRSRRR